MAKSKQNAFEFLMSEITPKSAEIQIRGRKFIVINRADKSENMVMYRLMAVTMATEKLKPNEAEWKLRPVTEELQSGFDETFKGVAGTETKFKNYYESVLSVMTMQFLLNIISVVALHDENGQPIAKTEAMIKGLIESLDQKTLNEINKLIVELNKQGEELAEKN